MCKKLTFSLTSVNFFFIFLFVEGRTAVVPEKPNRLNNLASVEEELRFQKQMYAAGMYSCYIYTSLISPRYPSSPRLCRDKSVVRCIAIQPPPYGLVKLNM